MKKWYAFCLPVLWFLVPASAQGELPELYNPQNIQELEIEFTEDNWRTILDSLRFNGDEMLRGDLTINGRSFPGVGVRIRDTHAFTPGQLRNSLHLQLNYTDPEQNYEGYQSMKLSTALRDPSMVREVLGYEIAREYMPAPYANYAKVMINDTYYGLLVNIEPIDSEPFLRRYFADTEGDLYRSYPTNEDLPNGCSSVNYGGLAYESNLDCYGVNYRIIKGNSLRPIQDLAAVLSDSEADYREVLDVDRTLWMLAFNNVLVNLSSYTGQKSPNYLLYREPSGIFSPIIWDLNLAFGSFKNTGEGSDLKKRELVQLDPLLHAESAAKPLISRLLSDELNRQVYLSHVRTILNDHFVNERYQARARELQELIRVPLINDRNRYYSSEEFDKSLEETIGELSKIPGLIDFMDDRASWLKKSPEMIVIPPQIGKITYKEREQFSRDRVEAFHIQVPMDRYTRRVTIAYRFSEDQPFQIDLLKDDGNNFDGEAGDQIFGIILDPPAGADTIEYYLMAANARAVSFSPHNYIANKHRVSLGELN